MRGGRVLSRLHARVAGRRRRGRRRLDRRARRDDGAEIIDASGRYVVPGFVDAHVHLESSKLLPDEFARLVLPLGTTAVVADPHEIANVLGTDGVHWLLDASPTARSTSTSWRRRACRRLHESPRRALSEGDLEALLRRRRVLGVAEMMNFPGVISGDASELAKIALADHVDGHAPGVRGRELRRTRPRACAPTTRVDAARRVASGCVPVCGC